MTLHEYISAGNATAAALARDAGVSRSYISHAVKGSKPLSTAAAISIWRARGVKFGPIANIEDGDIETLERIELANPRRRSQAA